MASLAFLVPLQGSWLRYRKICRDGQKIDSPYALFPSAECECWDLDKWLYANHTIPLSFAYDSLYDGVSSVKREIEFQPILMKLNIKGIGIIRYFLMLLVQIDKVFGNKSCYSNVDFCTEYDLINLKKAVFDNTMTGYYPNGIKGPRIHEWVETIVSQLEDRCGNPCKLTYSIMEINTQRLIITQFFTGIQTINTAFTNKYYAGNNDIDTFLQSPIALSASNGQTCDVVLNENYFVYGLLYANGNFMMTDSNIVKCIVKNYYSNNKVEKYWADDECLIHIKTGTPYYCPKSQDDQTLKRNFKRELPLVFDLAMLAFVKCELQKFLAVHKNMSSSEIEESQSMLADILGGKLFNQTEMDKRMDYFIKQFHLNELFKKVQEVVVPSKNLKDKLFAHSTTLWTIAVGTLTLIVTLIGIIISHNLH